MNAAPLHLSRRIPLTALAMLAISLLLAGACTAFFLVTARGRDTSRFERQVQMTQDQITAHLKSDITLLRGAAGFFAASKTVTLQEFRIYVQRLDMERYDPGVQGIGYSQRIPSSQKQAWVDRLRASGLPTFHLWPEEPREEYHSIIYLEPPDARNEAALGYDMFTEPTRRAAMERAWLSGEPALSGRVILKQEIDADLQMGFLLYVPVYRGGAVPASEAERREKLEGFVYSAFRAKDLFNGIFPSDPLPRIFFRIYDGMEARPEQLLYESPSDGERPLESPRFTHTSHLEFGGRPWTVVYTSNAPFEQTLLTPWVPAVGAMGLLLSLLVFTIAWTQISARQRAEASEAERAQLLAREQAAHAEAEAQRTYLHQLFMQVPALIGIMRGPQFILEFANSMYQQVMGSREMVGKPLGEVMPDLSPEILAMFDTLYRTGQPQFARELLIPIVYAHGQVEERYWNFVLQPRRSREGQVDGVLVFAFEVTDLVLARHEAEANREEARGSARKLQTITDTLPALVAYVDNQERYRFANRTYEAWFGLKPEELVGKSIREFIGEPAYEQFKDPIHRALAGEPVRYEAELPIQKGPPIHTQSSYLPDRDAQSRVRGFVVLAFDITERKRAEEAVRNAVRLRDEFLSVASHELKTPLTPLSLKLQMLAREAEAQPESPFVLKVRKDVEAGQRQIKRLADLIGDLLDVSRISSGRMKLQWEEVDFAAAVREVVARLEPEATRAESRLTVEAPEALWGRSDRMRFEQVAENLLTNAIKYGAGQPIHVRLEASPGRMTLTVRDQGIGIAPEHQARIFERFERAVSERNYGGLGLGLYITRTIVEALGGTIRVKSEPGQGACFTVELPREPSVP
ncbi:MAG: CHASE domain-containing protein [Hyalangium sp.]|uniref:CHASE domain-containing sensor histidine kinase n=1 Tax=Hyalangium sp. TaxID=2028555 RepID=UPI00389AE06C